MNMKQTLLTLLASSTLVACGSGLESEPAQIPTAPEPDITETTTTGPEVETSRSVVNGANGIPDYDVDDKDVILYDKEINNIRIDGETLKLVPLRLTRGDFFRKHQGIPIRVETADMTDRIVSGSYYDSRFGLVENKSAFNVHAFHKGVVTTNVPTTGKVNYRGEYTRYDHAAKAAYAEFQAVQDAAKLADPAYIIQPYLGAKTFAIGKLEATADFGSKKFSLDATKEKDDEGGDGFKFDDVDIKGNKFDTGDVKEYGHDGKMKVEGRFYGDNAEELGGTFHEIKETYEGTKNVYTAAFGAKKLP